MAAAREDRPVPVAQYLRMSTEHQRYSTTNQREAIEKYVAEHGMEVVRTYEDSGRSGLTLVERPALQELLADVHSPERQFSAIVAFDVSRWGRFQDVDESAYYEFVCRRAGVQVIYCAEPFGDVPGPMAVVIKSVKRAMAAEYSRELGVKVLAGKCQLARRGYHMGGFASFGLRRVMVSETGDIKGLLGRRELKSLQTDRVILEPADPLDVALVRHIFGLFVRKGWSEAQIAQILNWSCYPGRVGLHPWCAQTVRSVLRNEEYVGNLVYNRRSCTLRSRWVKNPTDKWVRAEHCFPGIISKAAFDNAKQRLLATGRHLWSDEQLLSLLRTIYAARGTVRASFLHQYGAPGTTIYTQHFGSLADACEAAGIPLHDRVSSQRRIVATRRALKIQLLEELARLYRASGVGFVWARTTRRACVDGGPTISVRTVQAFQSRSHSFYWLVTPDRRVCPDFSLVGRVAMDAPTIIDYLLLPAVESRNIFMGSTGRPAHAWAAQYRYETLEDAYRALELARLRALTAPRLTVNLAKRRRRMLGIKKRAGRLTVYQKGELVG